MLFAATPIRETPSDGPLVHDPDGLSNQTVLDEAVLDVENIHGLIQTGFKKDYRQLIYLKVSSESKGAVTALKH